MSSSDTLTYDQSPTHRPDITELGGGAKVNVAPEPDPVRQLRAEDINQLSQQAAAVGRVMPVALVQIEQTAGTYSVIAVSCAPTTPTTGTFTLTKNGTGDVSVTWPSGTFPSPIAKARAHVTGSAPLMVAAQAISNGVRVRMKNDTGTATDSHFDLDIF